MLGENLKALRTARGLSQEELACRLRVVRQTVSKWERDLSAPDAEMLVCIARELGVSVETLLDAPPKDTHAVPSPTADQWAAARRRERRIVCIAGMILSVPMLAVSLLFTAGMVQELLWVRGIIGDGRIRLSLLLNYLVSIAVPGVIALGAAGVLIASCGYLFYTRRK